jgi:hypothetical protein
VLERHDVVDPQAAGMAHVGPHQIDEAGIGFVPQGQRVEGRQAPVLSGRIEQVRRRSDMGGGDHQFRARPGLGSAAVGANRQVPVEPDRHPSGIRRRGGLAQLLVGDPLGPGHEVHFACMLLRELPDCGAIGIAVLLRPCPPVGFVRREVPA